MKLFVTRRAVRHVREIALYVRRHNPQAALEFARGIRDASELIGEHPTFGRRIKPDLRRLPVPRLPYLIYYSIRTSREQVEIPAVLNAARADQL